MEEDELEMSEEELQKWIREEVHKSKLISPDVLEKCNMLCSLLERKEKQAAHLLKLCESVAACEAIVKKQYSFLGWEYRDTHSDDDVTDCGHSPPSHCDSVHSKIQDQHSSATSPLLQKLRASEHLHSNNGESSSAGVKRKPVVVLARLPECKISHLHPSTPQKHCSESECLSSSDYDMQWEPEDNSSDSDYCMSSCKTGSKKRRKIDDRKKKSAKGGATPQASSNTEAKSSANKTSTPQANSKSVVKNSAAKPSPPKASVDSSTKSNGTTPMPEANRNDTVKSSETKTSSTPKNTNDGTLVCISALCQANETTNKTPPSVPQGEVCVNMYVVARRREMTWQRGKIKEVQTKEDGRVKYKVSFEDKGKSLVSGHHIAFDCMPKLEHLFVGTRVVVKLPDDQTQFCPGILAEVPCRRNRMRFLVFTDDHRPVYVGLPLMHLVYRPLPDPLDDISDDTHKIFMNEYLNRWPYPPQTQYKVGQTINAELNGVQERCEVQVVDCSLIQVIFQADHHKEWIYRGSIRLEHMVNMRQKLEARKNCLTSPKTVSH